MLPIDPNRETIYYETQRIPPVEDILFFFKHCFNPAERKFRMILLAQLGLGIRSGEAVAMHLEDAHPGTNYRVWDVLIQKKGKNYITPQDLPESIAAILRSWIIQNSDKIQEYGGYLFPPSHNHKYSKHVSAKTLQTWFGGKRKQLIKQFPDRSFHWIEGYKNYKKKNIGSNKEPINTWRPHLMKRMCGSFLYLTTKDPKLVQEMLNHSKLETTEKHYIAIINKEIKRKAINNTFDHHFYDGINDDKSLVCAVWDQNLTNSKPPS